MSRPDDPVTEPISELNEPADVPDVEALAAQYLAEAEAIESEAAESEAAEQAAEGAAQPDEPVPAEEQIPEGDTVTEPGTAGPETAPEGPKAPELQEAVHEEDFLPFSISVADADGLAVTVLDKGTKLPAAVKMNFSAPYKTPSAVKVRLYMGEGIFAKDNILIDYIKLPGIREYKGGITRIVMTLCMERNGDLEIDLLDEGSVSRKHDRIELNLAECREALKGKDAVITAEDAELRDSYLVIQRARYIAASSGRILKANKKELEKEQIVQIKDKIKELKSAAKKTDPTALTPAQKTAMKNLMNEISAMF